MDDLKRFKGVGVALVTPMDESGQVDFGAFESHVEAMLEGGVHFVVPCGTTGESATLTPTEQAAVIGRCVDVVGGRVPVVAGAGTNSTADAADLARGAAEAGADAVLSVSPYYNRPTPEGLRQHYRQVAESAGLPVFVYNVPGRTGANVEPATVFRLARAIPLVVGVKEASGDMQQAMTLLRDRPEGFLVLSGEDHLTAPMTLLGGDGVISVVANETPKPMADLFEAAIAGRLDEVVELHERLLPLMRANFVESNPIPVKTALQLMGRFAAHMRLPLTPLDPSNEPRLREALVAAGVSLPGAGTA